jgi:hypothetical protein
MLSLAVLTSVARRGDIPSRSRVTLQCVCQRGNQATYWVCRVLQTLPLSGTGPWRVLPRHAEGAPLFESTEAIHSWAFTLPQGLAKEHPSTVSVRVTARYTALSLSWGFLPYSDRQPKGAVSPGDSHPPARCVFRVRASLDALLSFEPSSHFWPGRSWDSPFRALLLPRIRTSFRTVRALLTLPFPSSPR